MPQKNNVTNVSALLRPGAEFHFCNNATAATQAAYNAAGGFIPFGNIVGITPNFDTQKVEHVSSNRGNPKKDREDITRTQVQFKVKVDEFNKIVQKVMLGASDVTGFTQSAASAASGDALPFGTTAAVIGNWYDLTISGARVKDVTSVTITSKTEGTDFHLDLKTGRIMFVTAQSSNLTPVITAPAITAGSNASFLGLKPLQQVKFSGFGRLLGFDQDGANSNFFDYLDFSCQVTLDSVSELNVSNFGDLTFNVLVTDTVGTWLTRTGVNAVSVG